VQDKFWEESTKEKTENGWVEWMKGLKSCGKYGED
jgi:hypothetical protein